MPQSTASLEILTRHLVEMRDRALSRVMPTGSGSIYYFAQRD